MSWCDWFNDEDFFQFYLNMNENCSLTLALKKTSIIATSMKFFIQSKNYETFLINYKNWSHDKFSSIDIIAIEFHYQSCIKNVITCFKCDITLIDWKFKNNFMKKHNQYVICAWIKKQIVIKKIERIVSFRYNQSKFQFVASSELRTKFKFFKFNVFAIDFILLDVDDIIDFINQVVNSSQFLYQHIVIMISTYEKRLITYRKWFHINFIFENFVVVEFCFESNTKNFTICSKCNLKLNNWKFKRNSIKAHMRQSSNCVFVQKLNITFKKTSIIISIIALINSTSMKFVSINDIAFSSQTFYLFIKNLYQKQKTLMTKNEKFETNKITIVIQFDIQSKTYLKNLYNFFVYKKYDLEKIVIETKKIVDVVVNFKSRFKVKFSRFFKSFKFEKFAINFNFNSTSIKSIFESIIKLNIVLVASSTSISICMSILNIEKLETKKIFIVVQKIMKQEIVVVVIEAIKSETCFKNINFFDFIMQINFWKKFRISINNASFLYHLIEFAVKYKKKSILKVFFRCFRDSALQWLKINSNSFHWMISK